MVPHMARRTPSALSAVITIALAATVGAAACSSTENRKDATCAGRTVDLLSDRANCGACGTACRFDHLCDVGVCKCLATLCGERCVDLQTDEGYCGSCDRACGTQQICDRGECRGS